LVDVAVWLLVAVPVAVAVAVCVCVRVGVLVTVPVAVTVAVAVAVCVTVGVLVTVPVAVAVAVAVCVGVAVGVSVTVPVAVAVAVEVGVAVGVSVGVTVGVSDGVAVGPTPAHVPSQNPNPIANWRHKVAPGFPEKQLMLATPPEQSGASQHALRWPMPPGRVERRQIISQLSSSQLVIPETVQVSLLTPSHMQHTPCATGTEATAASVVTAATWSATRNDRRAPEYELRERFRPVQKLMRRLPRRALPSVRFGGHPVEPSALL